MRAMQLDADVLIFDPDLTPGAGARDRRLHRPQGHRPHDADPRHLRAARDEPRRQAAGRAGAAALPAAAPAREEHDDVPAHRRHRRARPRRDQARDRTAAARASASTARAGDRALRPRSAPSAGRSARAAACRSSPSSATPTPASRRCSTRSPTATCSPRTSCSPRSTRRTRRLRFPREREVVITDTVGFIRDLPEDLAQRLPRHARGAGRRRPAAPRRRRRRPRRTSSRSPRSSASWRAGPGRDPRSWCEQDRPAAPRRTAPAPAGGTSVVAISARRSALGRARYSNALQTAAVSTPAQIKR